MPRFEVRRFIVISTGHVTEKTAKFLDGAPGDEWPCLGGKYGDYGWFLYAHDENCGAGKDAIPDDLFAVMTWAREQRCDYVLLDCDGDQVDALPHYDW
ncbi:MAG: hypothetical protein L0I29_01350 [Hyphomicrobiales bacterium]|nr:hypothetical protein [Hyphomicrobiales bacterium]